MKKKLFTCFIFLLLSTGIYAQQSLDKKISISFENIPLKKALKKLEKKGELSFAFNSSAVLDYKINANFKQKSISSILDSLFVQPQLDYELIAGNIIIFPKKTPKKPQSTLPAFRTITISGHVYDETNGEALIGCSVYDTQLGIGTVTNNFGFFSLTMKGDRHPIEISYLGYQTTKITLDKSVKITVKLQPESTELGEVIVLAENEDRNVTTNSIGVLKLSPEEIFSIPAIGGEVDVLKAITLLPGIKQGADGSAGFYVRGGSPDQNLILLDDVPLYNPYHLSGFLSSFNPDAINNISISKGAFPSRYGGRLSSVLDISMKDGNNQKFKTKLSMGILSAKVTISTPIVKNKSSLLISARRTFLDLLIFPLISKAINETDDYQSKQGYNFHDLNFKYNYKFSKNDRLYFSGFFGKDKIFQSSTYKDYNSSTNISAFGLGWSNLVASMRWNHLFGDKLFSNTTAYYSSYNYYTDALSKTTYEDPEINPDVEIKLNYSSLIKDKALKQDYQYFPNDQHLIRMGWGVIFHHFEPGVSVYKSETGEQTINKTIKDNEVNAIESSIYGEDDFDFGKKIKINAGIHVSAFFVNDRKYFSLQPRLSARYLLNRQLTLKLGYARMTQYMHLLTSSRIVQSTDLWVPSTNKIRPQRSSQVSIGSAFAPSDAYQLEIDAYYKKMNNLIEYVDGASFLSTSTSNWESKTTSGKGTSYGIELFLKKKTGKLTGWVSYTLSWANRTFENINFGKPFPFRYDRRHDIAVVASYHLSKKWTLNASWIYNSGNAVTVPLTAYVAPGYDGQFHSWGGIISNNTNFDIGQQLTTNGIIENTVARNNYRLQPYHRLDITFSRKKIRKHSERVLTLGIINAYNRLNPSFYQKSGDIDYNTNKVSIKYNSITLFPIMPTISYRISF